MNVTQTPAAVPKTEKFTLGGYARQEAKQALVGYKDAFIGTGTGLVEGYKSLKAADGFGASVKAGATAGFSIGQNLAHLAAVPLAALATVTHGLWAMPIMGAVGGFVIGAKAGEVMGRLNTADEPDSKKHKFQALVGSIGGGVAGAALGVGSPVAAAIGGISAITAAVKLVGGLGGGVVGGVIGLATWGGKKLIAALNKENPPAQGEKPPTQGEQPPAPPAEQAPPAAPPAEKASPAPPAEQAPPADQPAPEEPVRQ